MNDTSFWDLYESYIGFILFVSRLLHLYCSNLTILSLFPGQFACLFGKQELGGWNSSSNTL